MSTSSPTLLSAQTAALLSLLNLNVPAPGSSSSNGRSSTPAPPPANAPVWKVLVLDEASKDVLATTLRVQDLREQGVTLHMSVRPHLPRARTLVVQAPSFKQSTIGRYGTRVSVSLSGSVLDAVSLGQTKLERQGRPRSR